MDLAKSFVIGSSLPVVYPFYYVVKNIPETTIDKEAYPIAAAFYFGSMNVASKIIGNYMGWNLEERLTVICIISIIIIIMYITTTEIYQFKSTSRWIKQYAMVITGHIYAYLFAIYYMERMFQF